MKKLIIIINLLLISCIAFGQPGVSIPGNAGPRYSFNSPTYLYYGGAFHTILSKDSANLLYSPILSGTGFVKSTGGTISYDNSTYLTTTTAGTTYVPLTRTINGKALSSNITLGLASSDFANQGTTTTVLHGNASGNPSFGAVGLTTDVTGILPTANGGTGTATLSTAVIINQAASPQTGGLNLTGTGTFGSGVIITGGALNVSAEIDYNSPPAYTTGLFKQIVYNVNTQRLEIINNPVATGSGSISLAYGGDYAFNGTTATYTLPAVSVQFIGRYNEITIANMGSGTITVNSNAGGNDIYTTLAVATDSVLPGQTVTYLPFGTIFKRK